MAKIKIHEAATANWRKAAEFPVPETVSILSEGEANSLVNVHFAGDEVTPQLLEQKLAPGAEVHLHAHDHDEIMFIVGGSMEVGARSLTPGSSIYIAGGTYYQFKAGPNGMHFLNFRTHRDYSYILPKAKAS